MSENKSVTINSPLFEYKTSDPNQAYVDHIIQKLEEVPIIGVQILKIPPDTAAYIAEYFDKQENYYMFMVEKAEKGFQINVLYIAKNVKQK